MHRKRRGTRSGGGKGWVSNRRSSPGSNDYRSLKLKAAPYRPPRKTAERLSTKNSVCGPQVEAVGNANTLTEWSEIMPEEKREGRRDGNRND